MNELPKFLIQNIVDYISLPCDILALMKINKKFYSLFNPQRDDEEEESIRCKNVRFKNYNGDQKRYYFDFNVSRFPFFPYKKTSTRSRDYVENLYNWSTPRYFKRTFPNLKKLTLRYSRHFKDETLEKFGDQLEELDCEVCYYIGKCLKKFKVLKEE